MAGVSAENHRYRFGDFVLDTARGALFENGKEIKLRPQSYDVLRHLVEDAGNLVDRQTLQARVWGDKVVTDDSLTHCLIDIRKALGDSERKIVRTVARRGFIFTPAVTLVDVVPTVAATSAGRRTPFYAGLAAIAIVTTVVVLRLAGWPDRHDSPVIAVLPFVDMSVAQDQRYIGEGLSEDLLNTLAQSSSLRVIARTSSFSFRDDTPDIETIRKRLDVDYVLEGSIRRSDDRLRVTAQLIDARDSSHVWSQAFEPAPQDLYTVHQAIAASIVESLLPGEAPPPPATVRNVSAQELMLLARHYDIEVREQAEVDEDVLAEAIHLYREATIADPDWALAHGRLAAALLYQGDIRAAEGPIFRALSIDPDISEVQETLGSYYWRRGEPGAGSAWRRAIELNPNNADALSKYAYWLWMQGNDEEPETLFRRAVALDPLSLSRYAALGDFLAHQARVEGTEEVIATISRDFDGPDGLRVIARLSELIGRLDESIAWTLRARELEPANADHRSALAELYAELGDFATARKLEPGDSIWLLYKERNYPELIDVAELLMIEQPNDIFVRYLLGFALNATGRHERAIRILESTGLPGTVVPEQRQAADIEAFIVYIDSLDASGRTEVAREYAQWFHDKPHTANDNWWINLYRACALSILERDDEALAWLERLHDSPRLPWATVLNDSHCFQKYQDDARYRGVVTQVEDRRVQLRSRLPATLAAYGLAGAAASD